jgi:hypothetical protein
MTLPPHICLPYTPATIELYREARRQEEWKLRFPERYAKAEALARCTPSSLNEWMLCSEEDLDRIINELEIDVSRLNQPQAQKIRNASKKTVEQRARDFVSNLPPHVKNRESAMWIKTLLVEIDALKLRIAELEDEV